MKSPLQSLKIFLILCGINNLSLASETSRHLQIQVEQFATQALNQDPAIDVIVHVGEIDNRLELHECVNSLTLQLTQDVASAIRYGHTTVKVSCDDEMRWAIYVPLTVDAWRDVLVLTTAVGRGQALHAEDMVEQHLNLSSLHNYCYETRREAVINKVARLPLAIGSSPCRQYLEEPTLVKRGDTVTVISNYANIQVSTHAKARSDGRRGDTIDVENLTSRRVISAQVKDSNTVEVSL